MNRTEQKYQLLSWLICAWMILSFGAAQAQENYPDTSSDLFPAVTPVSPDGFSNQGAKLLPPTFTFTLNGTDLDSPSGRPARYRFMLKSAVDGAGNPIQTPAEYNLHFQDVLTLEDEAWSEWLDFPAAPEDIELTFVDLADDGYFLISVQVLDADGASNNPFVYQRSTFHIKVLEGFFRPEVYLAEVFLGAAIGSEMLSEIAAGQPLNFSWTASAEAYGGQIASYRHGWDLADVDDPNDPGWTGPPGLDPNDLYATERSFTDGLHTVTLRVEDDAGQVRVMRWTLRVVPYVSPEFQYPLLVLDQTVDNNAGNWVDQFGNPRNAEVYRNAWWQFLAEGVGGVTDLDWERDRRGDSEQVTYSDLVQYRAVLCYASAHESQSMFHDFRPVNGQDKYVWLTPYQTRGGNFFLVGGSSMESLLEFLPNYAIPLIFTTQETTYELDGQTYVAGFGTAEMPDGSTVERGPRMYPYATAGISALDWTSPTTKFIYGRTLVAQVDRKSECVGLKGLALAPAFKSHHLVGDAIADTIWTDEVIDWQDAVAAAADTLNLLNSPFRFRRDEFVDANISPRPTPFFPQECEDGPDGLCVQPMFTGISRFDFIRQYQWDRGDSEWPAGTYSAAELEEGCGPLALTGLGDIPLASALTNGRTYGYLSYKTVADKPSRKADAYWGFDPYRFNHDEAKQAVRWVLEYFGLQIGQ